MKASLFAELARLEADGQPFVVCTVIASQGSTPQKPGSRMVVSREELIGTIGGGAIEKQVVDAARALLEDAARETQTLETHLTHDLGMCCGGKMSVFLEKHGAPARLVVFGAGHVAKELADLAHSVGFQVTVVDERDEWLTAARFPHAQLQRLPPDVFAKELQGDATLYCCVSTHDHPLDQACAEALVRKPLAYLGVIGSKRKAARFRQRMEAAGFTEKETQRFESPMGVDIGALTPREIALSIVARLVSVRRAKGA